MAWFSEVILIEQRTTLKKKTETLQLISRPIRLLSSWIYPVLSFHTLIINIRQEWHKPLISFSYLKSTQAAEAISTSNEINMDITAIKHWQSLELVQATWCRAECDSEEMHREGGSGRRETLVKERWNNEKGKLSERRRVNDSGW